MTRAIVVEWNTGNPYQPQGHRYAGQVIRAELRDGVVRFHDLSRGIAGRFPVNPAFAPRDAEGLQLAVMVRYDYNRYECDSFEPPIEVQS